jgi:hypothetical protein
MVIKAHAGRFVLTGCISTEWSCQNKTRSTIETMSENLDGKKMYKIFFLKPVVIGETPQNYTGMLLQPSGST